MKAARNLRLQNQWLLPVVSASKAMPGSQGIDGPGSAQVYKHSRDVLTGTRTRVPTRSVLTASCTCFALS